MRGSSRSDLPIAFKSMFISLLFFLILSLRSCDASKAESALYRELLTNYNRLVRPAMNVSESVKIEMKIHLQQIMALDGKNQIIEINAWLRYAWTDYRLAWDPSKYGNITSVRFAGAEHMIWRPDILLYNSANEDFDSAYQSNEVVYNTGEVNWVPPGIFLASCKMDITYFPFDDQSCLLQFGSWMSHGKLVDLRFSGDSDKDAMDLSTYTPNGEWRLMSTPAVRRESICPRTKQIVPVLTFYLNLRRRTLFYLFNIVLPSLLISVMTLLGFCLPAHDMSEKIGFQTTILLSICFFVTIVSEMTPPTSESVPILGIFFSTLTLIISASTAFTITVLNIRYRQEDNHRMSNTFYQIFLVWLPWMLMMTRPGVTYHRKKEFKHEDDEEEPECDACLKQAPHELYKLKRTPTNTSTIPHTILALHPEGECECPECLMDERRKAKNLVKQENFELVSDNSVNEDSEQTTGLIDKLSSLPNQKLHLERKVGAGIFVPRSSRENKYSLSISERMEKYLNRCMEDAERLDETCKDAYQEAVLAYYTHIHENVRNMNTDEDEEDGESSTMEEWKFAAMALDRLCLIIFTFFVLLCIFSMVYSTPYLNA